MHGPDVGWYIVLAGLLFVIGAVGVLVRRSPLIILLSVEIMLNGGEPGPDRVRPPLGHEDGQVFAIAVMAVAASEVVIGLGLIVAMDAATSSSTSTSCGRCGGKRDERRRLGLPAAAARATRRSRLAGDRISRRGAGYLSTATTMARSSRRSSRSSTCSESRPPTAPTRRPRGRGSRRGSTTSA